MENSGSTPAFTVETFVQTFGTFEDEVLLDKKNTEVLLWVNSPTAK